MNLKERTGEAEAEAAEHHDQAHSDSYPPGQTNGSDTKRKIGLPASSLPYTSRDANGDREKEVGMDGKGAEGGATAARNNGKRGATPRRRKKKLSWWQKPVCLIGLVSTILLGIMEAEADEANLLRKCRWSDF